MTSHDSNNSGMCIPCTVRATPDKGLGVFAEAAISEGSTIWRHVAGQYEVLDRHSLARLLDTGSREDAVELLTHIVSMEEFPGYMINYLDEGALINHSDNPNVRRKFSAEDYKHPSFISVLEVTEALTDSHFDLVAARDLAVGDELLMDYNAEPDDPEYYEEACRRYGVNWEWL